MGTSLGAAALSAGLPALANLFGGLGSGQLSQSAQTEQYTLNKRNLADAEAELADQLQRQSQTNPLRDQSIYNLSQILGTPMASFNPTNYGAPSNTGQQGVGGANLNGLAKALSAYTPGAGGVTNNTQQMIMNRLGYGNVGTGTLFDNPTTPPDSLAGTPTATSATGGTAMGGQGVAGGNASGVGGGGATPAQQQAISSLAPQMQQAIKNAPPPAGFVPSASAGPSAFQSVGSVPPPTGTTAAAAMTPQKRALLQKVMGGMGLSGLTSLGAA